MSMVLRWSVLKAFLWYIWVELLWQIFVWCSRISTNKTEK